MTIFIVGLILVVAIFSYIFMETDYSKESIIVNSILGIIAGSILWTVVGGAILISIGAATVPTKWEYGWSNPIVAMKDGNAYVISRRNVSESSRYYYMVKYNEGYYKSHWVTQDKSKIFEVDNGKYEIKTYVEVLTPTNWYQRDMKRLLGVIYSDNNLGQQWEFYIPKGSIVQDFEIDLK